MYQNLVRQSLSCGLMASSDAKQHVVAPDGRMCQRFGRNSFSTWQKKGTTGCPHAPVLPISIWTNSKRPSAAAEPLGCLGTTLIHSIELSTPCMHRMFLRAAATVVDPPMPSCATRLCGSHQLELWCVLQWKYRFISSIDEGAVNLCVFAGAGARSTFRILALGTTSTKQQKWQQIHDRHWNDGGQDRHFDTEMHGGKMLLRARRLQFHKKRIHTRKAHRQTNIQANMNVGFWCNLKSWTMPLSAWTLYHRLPASISGGSSPGLIRHQKGCGCALLLTIAEVMGPMLPLAIFRYLRGSKKRNPGLCVCMCAYYCYDYYYHYYYYYLLMWVKL